MNLQTASSAWRKKNGVFYTPTAISIQMASFLNPTRHSLVLDPACGDGKLLATVADRIGTNGFDFVGIDKDSIALEKCRVELSNRRANFFLTKADFFELDLQGIKSKWSSIHVIMNPPFLGYGHMTDKFRKQILRRVSGIHGRFNAAHAFLKLVIQELSPVTTVCLLPGNWPNATYNDLSDIGLVNGNLWQIIPESQFDEVSGTFGLLVLRNSSIRSPTSRGSLEVTQGGIVRQGVATGADAVFMKIAKLRLPFGRTIPAIRGRDVRTNPNLSNLSRIWVPPNKWESKELETFTNVLPDEDRRKLLGRFCVRQSQQPLWGFHESIPNWFFGVPKLVIPEVCTRMSVLADLPGIVLPLHSTLAIRLDEPAEATRISNFLKSDMAWGWLRRNCTPMSNGAIRITTPSLRKLLHIGRSIKSWKNEKPLPLRSSAFKVMAESCNC